MFSSFAIAQPTTPNPTWAQYYTNVIVVSFIIAWIYSFYSLLSLSLSIQNQGCQPQTFKYPQIFCEISPKSRFKMWISPKYPLKTSKFFTPYFVQICQKSPKTTLKQFWHDTCLLWSFGTPFYLFQKGDVLKNSILFCYEIYHRDSQFE